jgi:hypothetical protein
MRGLLANPTKKRKFFLEFSEFSSEPTEVGGRARDAQHKLTSTARPILHDFCTVSKRWECVTIEIEMQTIVEIKGESS